MVLEVPTLACFLLRFNEISAEMPDLYIWRFCIISGNMPVQNKVPVKKQQMRLGTGGAIFGDPAFTNAAIDLAGELRGMVRRTGVKVTLSARAVAELRPLFEEAGMDRKVPNEKFSDLELLEYIVGGVDRRTFMRKFGVSRMSIWNRTRRLQPLLELTGFRTDIKTEV